MNPIHGQDARFFIAGVVLKFVVVKDLAQVDKAAMPFLCQIADDLGIGVEVSVLLIRKIRPFSDDGGCAENDPDVLVQHFVDDGGIEFLKFIGVCAGTGGCLVPDVIYADPDKYDIGFLGKNVIFQTQVEVINLVAADAGSYKVIIRNSFLRQGFLHFNDVTAGFGASLGDGVAKEDHFLRFEA